jgi:hypothetical protein
LARTWSISGVDAVSHWGLSRWTGSVIGPLLAACLLASCSAKESGPIVRGKVTAKGAPIEGALVVFHPRGQSGPDVVRPSAVTGADGTFVLRTMGKEGTPAGEYDVTIVWEKSVPPAARKSPNAERQDVLGGRYARASESGLKATVQAGDTDLPPFDLK